MSEKINNTPPACDTPDIDSSNIHESQELFNAIVNGSSEGIFVLNEAVEYVYINRAAGEMMLRNEKDWIGKRAGISVHPDDRQNAADCFSAALKDHRRLFETRIQALDGSYRYLNIDLGPLNWLGKPHVVGMVTDITETRLAVEELKRRYEFENLLYALSKDFINAPIEKTDTIISDALKKIGEYEKVERCYIFQFIDDDITVDMTHEWRSEGVPAIIDKFKKLNVEKLEWAFDTIKKGDVVHLNNLDDIPPEGINEKELWSSLGIKSLLTVPLMFENALVGFLGVETLKAEKEWSWESIAILKIVGEIFVNAIVRHSADRLIKINQDDTSRFKNLLEDVLDSIFSGLIVFDDSGRTTIINRAGLSILNIDESEIFGKKIEDIFPALSVFGKITETNKLSNEVVVNIQNRKIYLGYSTSKLNRSSGMGSGIITIFRDLTEIKEIRRELREKEKLAAIGQITGGIAHEIRNPLFAISSGIQLLQESKHFDSEEMMAFDIIFKETMRVDRLIKQLVNYTTYQALNRSSINIPEIIDWMVNLNRGKLQSREINLIKKATGNMPDISADKDKLIQAFSNILQNAVEASEIGGIIEIECSWNETENCVNLKIIDKGIGVPEHFREKIFEPFFTTKRGSIGMGLSISKRIIEDHDGEIKYEPREGGGSILAIKIYVTGD